MTFTLYILKTSSDTLYVGQTNNLERRIEEHKSHTRKSSKYMRAFKTFEVVYTEEYETRREAMQREYEIKKMTRKDKDALITQI